LKYPAGYESVYITLSGKGF